MQNLITIQAWSDARAADVAAAAVERANRTLNPVRFRFHGVLAIAMPGDSANGVLCDWFEDYGSTLRPSVSR